MLLLLLIATILIEIISVNYISVIGAQELRYIMCLLGIVIVFVLSNCRVKLC